MSVKQITLVSVVGMLLLTTIGCNNNAATKRQQQEADSLINVAYEANALQEQQSVPWPIRASKTRTTWVRRWPGLPIRPYEPTLKILGGRRRIMT